MARKKLVTNHKVAIIAKGIQINIFLGGAGQKDEINQIGQEGNEGNI